MADLATLKLVVDSTGAIRAVDSFGNAVDATVKKTDKLGAAAKVAGVALAAFGAYALHKVVEESKAAQFAQAQLEAAIKSTGGAAGQSVRQLNDHAAALQKVTTYGDDAISSMQGVLLTFTKISGDVFPKATTAVLDMATRLGTDLSSAAIQVGKALNDPILGVTALGRAGVQFSEEQKAMIESLVRTNRLADAQAVILKELEVQFGGSAKAARNTLGGALQALSNVWGDAFEVSREKSAGIIFFIEKVTAAVPKLRDVLSDTVQGWRLLWVEMQAETTKNLAKMERDIKVAATGGLGGALYGLTGGRAGMGLIGKSGAAIVEYDRIVKSVDAWAEAQNAVIVGAKTMADILSATGDTAGKTAVAVSVLAARYERLAVAAATAGRSLTRQSLAPGIPTITGIQNGQQVTYTPGQGVMSIPGNAIGSGDLRNPAPKWLADMQAANDEVARNFRENLQRATGDIFAEFLREGKVSVTSIARMLADAGAASLGNKAAGWLQRNVGALPPGLDIAATIVGSVFSAFGASARKFRQEMEAAEKAMGQLDASVTDWIRSATESMLTPEERQRLGVTRQSEQFAADAWRIYRNAPGDYRNGLTGNADTDRTSIERALANAGGDWQKLWGFGDTPVKLLQDYYEALKRVSEGTTAHTDAINAQAEAEKRAAAIQRISQYQQTIEGLQGFQSSLKRSNLSTLNPFEQLTLARNEYDALFAKAMGGDQSAAARLPDAARAFLEQSRGVNASGGRYNVDFTKVLADTDRVTAMFQDRKTAEEALLGIATETNERDRERERREVENETRRRGEHDEIVTVTKGGYDELREAIDMLRVEVVAVRQHTRESAEALAS